MPIAGHKLELYFFAANDADATPSSGNYIEIDGINDVSMSNDRTVLDKTDFKDTSGAKLKFNGMRDGSISCSGDLEPADLGFLEVVDAADSAADDRVVWVQILWDGTTGHHVKCVVENLTRNAGVDGKVEVSFELPYNGLPAANPA